MLNGNNPVAALEWWQGSCKFNDVMVDQALDTFDRAPTNYRDYIGAGSQRGWTPPTRTRCPHSKIARSSRGEVRVPCPPQRRQAVR